MVTSPVPIPSSTKYVTLEGLELGNQFITPYDTDKDTPESIVLLSNGTLAYKILGFHKSIPDAQIHIYGRAY